MNSSAENIPKLPFHTENQRCYTRRPPSAHCPSCPYLSQLIQETPLPHPLPATVANSVFMAPANIPASGHLYLCHSLSPLPDCPPPSSSGCFNCQLLQAFSAHSPQHSILPSPTVFLHNTYHLLLLIIYFIKRALTSLVVER